MLVHNLHTIMKTHALKNTNVEGSKTHPASNSECDYFCLIDLHQVCLSLTCSALISSLRDLKSPFALLPSAIFGCYNYYDYRCGIHHTFSSSTHPSCSSWRLLRYRQRSLLKSVLGCTLNCFGQLTFLQFMSITALVGMLEVIHKSMTLLYSHPLVIRTLKRRLVMTHGAGKPISKIAISQYMVCGQKAGVFRKKNIIQFLST